MHLKSNGAKRARFCKLLFLLLVCSEVVLLTVHQALFWHNRAKVANLHWLYDAVHGKLCNTKAPQKLRRRSVESNKAWPPSFSPS